jgi:hypothetical protein
MKIYAVLLSVLISMPAWACIWDADCPPGDECVKGKCQFMPPSPIAALIRGQNVPPTKEQLDQLAGDFFADEHSTSKMALLNVDPHRCEQEQYGHSCVDVSCQFLGSFGCDDVSEVERVGRACRGNFDGECVNSTCTHLGSFGCDDIGEIERVTALCRGNYGGKCVDVACQHLGRFGCDEISEIERVNGACQGVKASCLESVCQKLGTFGCDDISEIERVASSCRGN